MRLINSLSGRFLILTIIFVMIAEILIFVPSVARFRMDWLQERMELSQIASLAVLADPEAMVDPALEQELLDNADVLNIVLRRDAVRELVLSSPMPEPVDETFDLRGASPFTLIWDAICTIVKPQNRIIRVIGTPVKGGGMAIEATLREQPLRDAMLYYGINVFWLSLFISAVTATLLFLTVRGFLVKPIKRVVHHMITYREDPNDAHRIITPQSGVVELRQAETSLADLQTQLTASLRQKDRLAALGGAVSRISHDLRNMLTTAQLLADRIDRSADPSVARSAPKLIGSLDRAINLCERTLTFGKAEEPAPAIGSVLLPDVIRDVFESDRLQSDASCVTFTSDVPEGFKVTGDPEQLYRVFANLVRNARQAIEAQGKTGEIRITAEDLDAGWDIRVSDTGPGLPPKALEHLFKPFQGGARRGGTGLGLAIAAELVQGHGGRLELVETSELGTAFRIFLPRRAEEIAA